MEIVGKRSQYRQKGEPELTQKDVRIEFPSFPGALYRQDRVTRSLRCESALVMKIINEYADQWATPSMDLEMGLSNSLWILWEAFMSFVKAFHPKIKITVSTNRGKNIDQLRLPPWGH